MHMTQFAGRVAGALASVLLGTMLTGAVPASALAPDCGTWSTTQIKAPLSVLSAATVLPSGRAWAAGIEDSTPQTLAVRWNGTVWKQVPSPDPSGSGNDNAFNGVAASSSRNVWAVGYYNTNPLGRTLIEHWDGTAWSQLPTPNPGGTGTSNDLLAAAIVPGAASSAWAVGSSGNQTLVLNWSGSTWAAVPSAKLRGPALLASVVATSQDNAWAVGWHATGATLQTLIEHWDGSAWATVPSPDPGGPYSSDDLFGVAANSLGDVVAVGDSYGGALALYCT